MSERYGKSTSERFWEKVEFIPFHECWEWSAACNVHGYGAFRLDGKTVRAHRLAWEFVRGPIPEGGILLHSCDNPGCVNPAHLRVGAFSENTQDMRDRGRSRFSGCRPGYCRKGHRVSGDNAKPSGWHGSGARRYRCRRCANEWAVKAKRGEGKIRVRLEELTDA